jgi:dihydrodipicolinate reductase
VIPVAVIGVNDRMGRTACETVPAAEGLELKARIGRGDDFIARPRLALGGIETSTPFG